MRLAAALALLAVLLLAGCAGKGPDDGGPDDPAASGTASSSPTASQDPVAPLPNGTQPAAAPTLTLDGCTNHGGVFPVPMAGARAALPEGFEPIPSPSDPAGGATLYVLFLVCEGSSVDGNDTGPANVAYAELAVVPPDALKLPGVSDYTVPLAIGASAEPVADRLALYRLGIAGRSTVSDVVETGSGGTFKMTFEGVTLEIDAVAGPPAGALADGAFALVGVQDGAARTVVQARSQGGQAAEGAAVLRSEGLPLLQESRNVNRGFSVSGFTLSFELAATLA